MLIQTVGRKSGKHHRQPVSYVPDEESLPRPFVVGTAAEADRAPEGPPR